MQDATPLTLGQEWSGYAGMLADNLERIEDALKGVYRLALGGTAVGTGINAAPGFAEAAAAEIAKLTGLPFVSAPNKFTVQGAHDALVQLSGTLRTLAVSLYKIANDIRLMSCGPRAGFAELMIPENEPGSSIMPGKVNPTQAEALTMIAVQVMANDVAVGFGGAGGYLEMNVYKPLMIFNITHSITIMTDGCTNFRKFLVEGTKPNLKKIKEYVDRSLMLVTALAPVIGYDKASKIAHYAMDNDLTLKAAALKLGFVDRGRVRPRRRSGEDGQAVRRHRQIAGTRMSGTIADLMAETLRLAGVRRIYGVAGDSSERLHRFAAPAEDDRLGPYAPRRGGRLRGRRRSASDRASSPSARGAAAPATSISSTACSTASAAAFRCWRSPRTSRAPRSAAPTSRKRIRRSCSANARTMSSSSRIPSNGAHPGEGDPRRGRRARRGGGGHSRRRRA